LEGSTHSADDQRSQRPRCEVNGAPAVPGAVVGGAQPPSTRPRSRLSLEPGAAEQTPGRPADGGGL